MSKIKRIISFLLVVVMLLGSIMFTMTACGKNKDGSDGDDNEDKNPDENSETVDYTVNLKTEGGMPVAEHTVLIYSYADGALGKMVDFAITDATGKATFKVTGNATDYAIRIDSDIPEGYAVEPHYPLVGTSLDIAIKTSLVSGKDFSGKTFALGDMMYDFTTTDVFGNRINLGELLQSKKMVLLNFWYIDCSACQLEFPFMSDVYEQYKNDVAVIALNPFDQNLDIRNFANQNSFPFNVLEDKLGIYQSFSVEYYPTSVIIDRYGTVSLIEVGAIPDERGFKVMFDHYTAADYVQKKVNSLDDITPIEYPDVEMPSSDELGAVFDGNLIEAEYSAVEEDEMSWPFVIGDLNGTPCIKTSNATKISSYAQMKININLAAGQVLAFDYFSSTEANADILYVLVDGKDIFKISGESADWATCYAYVAKETASYELSLVYIKDGSKDVGNDTVYLKNLRIVAENDINSPTYIYRFASNKPNDAGKYQEYVNVVLGDDGYYHVNDKNGPLLLASLLGIKTHFSSESDIYTMTIGMEIEDEIVKYCNYASNSQIYGVCTVNEQLAGLLKEVVRLKGTGTHDKTWLEVCCYYDAYGPVGTPQLSDPIKGLAPFSAYRAVETPVEDYENFPNTVTYDRPIMPRGLFYHFRPDASGVYQITSNSEDKEVNGWIFKEGDFETREVWLTYDNVDRMNTDLNNVYMIAYLQKNVDYYINIAYYDVYETGTFNFKINRLDDDHYRFSLASPGFFTYHLNESGTVNKIIGGGIDVELGLDKIWREKRTDGRVGSVLYADFTFETNIFGPGKPIYSIEDGVVDLIEAGAFNFQYSEYDLYVLNTKAKYNNDVEATKAALRAELGEDLYGDYYVDTDGNVNKGYAVDAVLNETYHGILAGHEKYDYSDDIRAIAENNMIKEGDVISGETVGANDERIGCVIVTEELAKILQLLMDKYTFAGVDNSWTKLCYYREYFYPEN